MSLEGYARAGILLIAVGMICLGTYGIVLAGEPATCHGAYTICDHDQDPYTPPVRLSDLMCMGECPPEDPACAVHIAFLGGAFSGRAYCACCNGVDPVPEPGECHMFQDFVVLEGVMITEDPVCVGDCPPQEPLCLTLFDEPNEIGVQRGWCECIDPVQPEGD